MLKLVVTQSHGVVYLVSNNNLRPQGDFYSALNCATFYVQNISLANFFGNSLKIINCVLLFLHLIHRHLKEKVCRRSPFIISRRSQSGDLTDVNIHQGRKVKAVCESFVHEVSQKRQERCVDLIIGIC